MNEAWKDQLERFAERELNPGLEEREQSGVFPRELWKKMGDLRLPGLCVPEEYSGAGLDAPRAAETLEILGNACRDNGLVFSLGAHLVAVALPIARFGTEEQKKKWLPGLANGTWIGAHALTEPGSGSDAFSMKTKAVREGKQFRITGSKAFITNAPVADVAIVFAMTDEKKGAMGGTTAFIVDLKQKGIERGKAYSKMGLQTSPIGEIFFQDVLVDEENVLGGVGGALSVFTLAMNWERTLIFSAHVGTLQRLLDEAVQYAKTRIQFGKPISRNQAISHPLAEMKMKLEASRLLVRQAASVVAGARGLCIEACIAKLFVSESLVAAAAHTLQVHGGFGYMRESGIEREARDAQASLIYSGTSEMQRELIAKWLGL